MRGGMGGGVCLNTATEASACVQATMIASEDQAKLNE